MQVTFKDATLTSQGGIFSDVKFVLTCRNRAAVFTPEQLMELAYPTINQWADETPAQQSLNPGTNPVE